MQESGAPEAPQGIRAFDQYGREVIVPREEWAANILPGMLKETWDQPDQLYALILNSLNDGFVAEVTEAAAHLYKSDSMPARGATMWAIVLMQAGRLEEAEGVLTAYAETQPLDGSILINLAKVYGSTGRVALAESTLWKALEVEPNLDNGISWYAGMQAERAAGDAGGDHAAGERAGKDALERIAAMPGSWRAQLWLARGELNGILDGRGSLESAKKLYAEALARAPQPTPPELLMQMSGDLGGAGYLIDLLELTAPHFIPELHGLPVGNNLIKAAVDTGNLDLAGRIKDALFAQNRPDWKDPLTFWDGEIARRRNAAVNVTQPTEEQVQIGMLRVDGPVWLPVQSPARNLFGAKPQGSPSVAFLGGTAETPEDIPADAPAEFRAQLADAIGRLTRSLPLFFAEQVEMRTAASGRAILPWAVGVEGKRPSGFVVSGARWPDQAATQMVSDPTNQADYVVTVHLDAEVDPWTAELAFIRTADGARIGELQAEFPPSDPSTPLLALADEVVDLLSALGPVSSPELYQVPTGPAFGAYLLRMEQLLAVRCATMPGAAPMLLSGEREILDGDLELCLAEPQNLPSRLLLIETLGAMTAARPQVAEEFRGRFQQLVAEWPIAALDVVFAQTVA